MSKYLVNLPDEYTEIIQEMGFDVDSYLQTMLIKPLEERHKNKLEQKVLDEQSDSINLAVKEKKDQVTFDKVIDVKDKEEDPEAQPVQIVQVEKLIQITKPEEKPEDKLEKTQIEDIPTAPPAEPPDNFV